MKFAARLVAIHDEHGYPVELSLQMAAERGVAVPLLGLVLEMAERNWGPGRVREVAGQWAKLFAPAPGERRALEGWGL